MSLEKYILVYSRGESLSILIYTIKSTNPRQDLARDIAQSTMNIYDTV